MVKIIRGTTPTIEYKFRVVNVSDISVAVLTFKQGGNVVIEKDLETATIGENSLSWRISQEESLLLEPGAKKITIMLNWKLQDGTRGASNEEEALAADNHKNEVI